jgi:hypothetical protein
VLSTHFDASVFRGACFGNQWIGTDRIARRRRLRDVSAPRALAICHITALANCRSSAFGDPYFHKAWSELGSEWTPNWRYRFAVRYGALHAWQPPYPEIYDGCQEIAIGLRMTRIQGAALQQRIGSQWPKLRERLIDSVSIASAPANTLLFPAGGSFQDFDENVVREILDHEPQAKVARHTSDERPAEVRYERFEEVLPLLAAAEHVITNDSAVSHLAQFYCRRHTLVCSRSRPANVVFPGAKNTTVIDLGSRLSCRPCFYLPLRRGRCAAGYQRCAAFNRLNSVLVHR